jgi:hypothetical protein
MLVAVTSLQTPWHVIDPSDPPYVLASDEPHIRAFNATVGEGSRDAFDLTLLPDPWVGRLQAPVVLLNLNPGHSPGDAAAHQLPEVRRAIVANLRQEPTRFPLFYLDPDLANVPGARWWRQSLRRLIERFGAEQVANQVVCLEFHAYHSGTYKPLPVTLPSQWFVFGKLREAIDRGATVVVMRGQAAWRRAVPELLSHQQAFTTRSVRASVVSPRNCPDGWDQILVRIEAPSNNT